MPRLRLLDTVTCMDLRVRAIAITETHRLVVLRRERIGRPVYRVLPGGGVEGGDPGPEAALARELDEELGALATIGPCVHEIVRATTRELFYVCRVHTYSPTGGHGPEWRHADPGNRYEIEELDLDPATLRGSGLVPHSVVELLCTVSDPFDLPALRI